MYHKTRLKIGEFSQMMQVTVKTLRHYEQKGLLLPNEKDEWTGYRYYCTEQMQRLNSIRNLQRLGFSLDEIKELYADSTHTPSIEQITEKIDETDKQIERLITRLRQLKEWRDSQTKINVMERFSIQSLPEIIVASHRKTIANYNELGHLLVSVVAPEMQRLGCKCTTPSYCFTSEFNNEYKPTDIDIEYCEQVEEIGTDSSIIKFKTIPAVPTAVCMKHYGPYEKFYESYVELFEYIDRHGYRITGRPRCCYIDGIWNQSDPQKWLSIIQVPVEKNNPQDTSTTNNN